MWIASGSGLQSLAGVDQPTPAELSITYHGVTRTGTIMVIQNPGAKQDGE